MSNLDRRGYCGVGIVGAKTPANLGTLWRSAALMEASFIFTIGKRWPKQASDTVKAWRHIPLYEYESIADFKVPNDCSLVAVEQAPRSRDIRDFNHPERAIYLLGAEDRGVPQDLLKKADSVIEIPSEKCLNVAVAGSIVLYDRLAKT